MVFDSKLDPMEMWGCVYDHDEELWRADVCNLCSIRYGGCPRGKGWYQKARMAGIDYELSQKFGDRRQFQAPIWVPPRNSASTACVSGTEAEGDASVSCLSGACLWDDGRELDCESAIECIRRRGTCPGDECPKGFEWMRGAIISAAQRTADAKNNAK